MSRSKNPYAGIDKAIDGGFLEGIEGRGSTPESAINSLTAQLQHQTITAYATDPKKRRTIHVPEIDVFGYEHEIGVLASRIDSIVDYVVKEFPNPLSKIRADIVELVNS